MPMTRLRRSFLSVPGNREKMLKKAVSLKADVVMLDLEDSVPLEEKDSARKQIIEALNLPWQGQNIAVRINAMNTQFAYKDIMDILENAGSKIDIIVVPKVEEPAEVRAVDLLATQICKNMGIISSIAIDACIESPLGLSRVEEIARSSNKLEALVFGIADYIASMYMPAGGYSGHGEHGGIYREERMLYPLSRLAVAARAAGLQVVDAPYGDIRDLEGLESSARFSAELGYDGKWAIHPEQIEVLNQVYTPSEESIKQAKEVLEASSEFRTKGLGTSSLQGKMIDAASLRVAEVTWNKWQQIKKTRE